MTDCVNPVDTPAALSDKAIPVVEWSGSVWPVGVFLFGR